MKRNVIKQNISKKCKGKIRRFIKANLCYLLKSYLKKVLWIVRQNFLHDLKG